MDQPLDASRFELAGEPVPIAEQVGSTNTYGNYSVSLDGTLAYRVGAPGGQFELAWIDRSGRRVGSVGGSGARTFEALSPDQKTVAYVQDSAQGATSDIWLYDIARGTNTRFTFGPGLVISPVWSPDSRMIAYGATSGAAEYDIYRKPASGAAKEELILKAGENLRLSDWSSDGKTLAYIRSAGNPNVWLLPVEGGRKPTPFLQSKFFEFNGQFSPDGRWIAYTSNESGQNQVYVQPFPPNGAKWQVSVAGGDRARWRRDGKELFYIAADQRLMAVAIKIGSTFEAAIPQSLFPTSVTFTLNNFQFFYTPAPDGQRFLLRVPTGTTTPSPVTVVLNWRAAKKKLVRP
jgi:dipeptidyl aminopeptidase/acylaminoacyl peptidase